MAYIIKLHFTANVQNALHLLQCTHGDVGSWPTSKYSYPKEDRARDMTLRMIRTRAQISLHKITRNSVICKIP